MEDWRSQVQDFIPLDGLTVIDLINESKDPWAWHNWKVALAVEEHPDQVITVHFYRIDIREGHGSLWIAFKPHISFLYGLERLPQTFYSPNQKIPVHTHCPAEHRLPTPGLSPSPSPEPEVIDLTHL